jgi:hypothetical protein
VPLLRYPLARVPPVWLAEQGPPMPTYPCPRLGCGREVPVRFKGFRVEHLQHVGWEELPEDARRTFAEILEAIAGAGNFRDRNVDTTDGYARLQDLQRIVENFLGTMIRGRENDLLLRTDRDGAVGSPPIGPTEGLGEETSFLFSTRHPAQPPRNQPEGRVRTRGMKRNACGSAGRRV